MSCCKCHKNLVLNILKVNKGLILQQTRCHSTKWINSTFSLTLQNDNKVSQTYQLELGEAILDNTSTSAPSILAVHPTGSSYKQFSGLSSIIKPGSCSGLFGLNMFGYGLSDRWNGDHRRQTIQDHAAMVSSAVLAARPEASWHLIGHSMGGGSVLAAAATQPELSSRLSSVTVFEPNLFSLLQAGNQEEQRVLADGDLFFHHMLKAAAEEDWDLWGKLFYRFWFDGNWEGLEESTKNVLLQSTMPTTVHEIQGLKGAIDQGPDVARNMMDNLADLKCRKRMIISAVPGLGSKDSLFGLARLLKREAGFEIVRAPIGGHMGPVTHRDVVLPLLLS